MTRVCYFLKKIKMKISVAEAAVILGRKRLVKHLLDMISEGRMSVRDALIKSNCRGFVSGREFEIAAKLDEINFKNTKKRKNGKQQKTSSARNGKSVRLRRAGK